MLTVNEESNAFPKENLLTGILAEKTYFEDYIVIDFGLAKRVTAIGLIGHNHTVNIEANASDSWDAPAFSVEMTTSEMVEFVDQTYRYWRIVIPGSGGVDYLRYFYLGEYLQIPYPEPGSTPNVATNDIIATTSGYQRYTTRGTTARVQSFEFYATTQAEYELFRDWWNSDDRSNNLIFVQFEDDNEMTHFPSYLAKVVEFVTNNRSQLAYDWSITIEEAK
jgi:hypothetical protein